MHSGLYLKQPMTRVLITTDDLLNAIQRKGWLWRLSSVAILHLMGLRKLNKAYNLMYRPGAAEFIDAMFQCNNNSITVESTQLENIPREGGFIVVSNHPYGSWDYVTLIKIFSEIRPDSKFMANFLVSRIEPLKPFLFDNNHALRSIKRKKSEARDYKSILRHISLGHPAGFFPAGEVSSFNERMNRVFDRKWQQSIVRLIYNSKVPVIPVFFPGSNSNWFHRFRKIHPLLSTLTLPGEMLRLTNTQIVVNLGAPVNQSIKNIIKDENVYGSFMKMCCYALGNTVNYKNKTTAIEIPEPIIESVLHDLIKQEVESIKATCFLFQIENYHCYLASKSEIPNIFTEISRLREITFREIGEGTGKSCDTDKFDEYYKHLFIWDFAAEKLVGAYRIGFGKEIMKEYGHDGFYTSTLFEFKPKFHPFMENGIELGRSFVVNEYQKKSSALFLLWKGIIYVLLKKPEYRYVLGPASISNNFSDIAKICMVEFFKRNYSDDELSHYVTCRNEFRYKLPRDLNIVLKYCGNDIKKIDRIIEEFSTNGMKIPVLLRKYLSMGAKIVHFNVDPEFNNAIDGFMINEVKELPLTSILAFAKEIDDPELITRFSRQEVQ